MRRGDLKRLSKDELIGLVLKLQRLAKISRTSPSHPRQTARRGANSSLSSVDQDDVSGHKAGVTGIYNRSSYAVEKRVALELWGEFVNSDQIYAY